MMDPLNNSEKCSCDKTDKLQDIENTNTEVTYSSKSKKSRINVPFLSLNFRRGNVTKRSKKLHLDAIDGSSSNGNQLSSSLKKSPKWPIKFICSKKDLKTVLSTQDEQNCCKCTCYKKKDENILEQSVCSSSSDTSTTPESTVSDTAAQEEVQDDEIAVQQLEIREYSMMRSDDVFNENVYGVPPGSPRLMISASFLDMQCIRTVHEDCDEAARLARAREIEQGVDAPANFRPVRRVQLLCSEVETDNGQGQKPRRLQLVCPRDLSVDSLRALFHTNVTLKSCPADSVNGCHTQVDFIHCLVPDLLSISNCSFYWGKMDRYEAERLLDGKPEGTFLLRDSAQEEFLFSVSFRKYGRSLHARIEQWNHKFSFDSHDPGVFTSDTVCGLIEHYKDPSSCMFFEPMLTWPLHRNFPFSLQHLSRAVITNRSTYDCINHLQLPKTLKNYLKEYHYRQKVRVKRFDDDVQWLELQNM